MKCVVPGVNVKAFGKAVHCLSKVGDDIWFEPLDNNLVLRSVNLTRSAYSCFTFFPSFFQYFDPHYKVVGGGGGDGGGGNRCKVNGKSCVGVFKSLSGIEKAVEKCRILLDQNNSRLVFQLCCKHGIVKTFNLTYADCDPLRAKVPREQCHNHVTTHSRLLSDVLINFQSTLEEVTLSTSIDFVKVSNYVEDEPDASKLVYTELKLSAQEFDEYEVGLEGDITFCVRELRALLSFTDTVNMPLKLHFDGAGKPVVISIDSDPTFQVNLVLATVDSEPGTASNTQQSNTMAQAMGGRGDESCNVMVDESLAPHHTHNHVPPGSNPDPEPPRANNRSTDDVHVNSEDEYQEDFVPPSPPAKKLKTLILGSSQASGTSVASGGNEVLAVDSDEAEED